MMMRTQKTSAKEEHKLSHNGPNDSGTNPLVENLGLGRLTNRRIIDLAES